MSCAYMLRIFQSSRVGLQSSFRAMNLGLNHAQSRSAGSYSDSRKQNELAPLVLHCQFTNNNTILTLSRRKYKFDKQPSDPEKIQEYMIDQVRPDQEIVCTVSTGQLGFKGTHKSTYDAAFQTTAKMFKEIENRNLIGTPIELVTRNFGQNRHAFFATLLGKEGLRVSQNIKRVTDATRIKFGGDRSPNKRRI